MLQPVKLTRTIVSITYHPALSTRSGKAANVCKPSENHCILLLAFVLDDLVSSLTVSLATATLLGQFSKL